MNQTEIKIVAEAGQVLGRGEHRAAVEIVLHGNGENSLVATVRHPTDGEPMGRYHGVDRAYTIAEEPGPVIADPEKMQAIAEELRPLVARIQAGLTPEWDGSNMVGVLTDEARAAEDELLARIAPDPWGKHPPGLDPWTEHRPEYAPAWLEDSSSRVTAETTDEEAAALVEELVQVAKSEKVLFEGYGDEESTVAEIVKEWREEAAGEADAGGRS